MIVVPAEVVEAVAEHARAVDRERPGFESLGVLVCDGDRAMRYARLGNPARRPYQARVAAPRQLVRRGRRLIPLHSHPRGSATPSQTDVEGASRHGWEVFAIYSLATGELRCWSLDGAAPREVEFTLGS
ncbi:MAG: Mov34/MPN/PAD-1 family protein [Gaiellaceae bacterium]